MARISLLSETLRTGVRSDLGWKGRRRLAGIGCGLLLMVAMASSGLAASSIFSAPIFSAPSASSAAATAKGPAPAKAPERTLALVRAAEVTSAGVFLDDILTTTPAEPVPHLRVGDAPTVGETATLTRAEINAWLLSNAPDLHSTNWVGLDRVRISRRLRSLDEVELRELLSATLQREYVGQRGELELRLTRAWNSIQIPDESLSLRVVDLPATGPSANFIVRFELWNGEERLGQWQTSAAAKIWREVPVAQAPLKVGQLLSTAPITFDRRDVLALRDAPGVFALDDPTLELAENIPANHAVLARSVRPRPVIFRGQTVDAVIQDGALMISLRVETLQDGLPGQLVRVRNPRTRRELTGKVLDEQTILIGR